MELNPRELALLEFLLRRRSEVVSKREILELFHGRLRPGSAGEKLDHSLADAGQVGAELHEHLGGDALTLADQAEQQVLGAEVVVVEQPGFVLGKHNDPSSPVGEGSGHRPHSRNSTAAPSHLARYTMASRTIPQVGRAIQASIRADSTQMGTGSRHQDPSHAWGCGLGCRHSLGGQWARGSGS